MRRVVGVIVASWLAAGPAWSVEDAQPAASAAAAPQLTRLYFAGADLWRNGAFAHAGLLWSPRGLDTEGFTLKLLLATGAYRNHAEPGQPEVVGGQLLGAVMPGWRFKFEKLELTAAVGLDLQHHRFVPDDPASRYRGSHAGVRAGADLWYEPAPNLMLAANVSVSTIGPSYWSRAAAGVRLLDAVWIGPELHTLGDPTYRQYRVGAHVTGLKLFRYEWSAGAGYVTDSDRRRGPYVRFGVLARR
jgi:hypothetical protein